MILAPMNRTSDPEDEGPASSEFAKALEEFERGGPPAAAARASAEPAAGVRRSARVLRRSRSSLPRAAGAWWASPYQRW